MVKDSVYLKTCIKHFLTKDSDSNPAIVGGSLLTAILRMNMGVRVVRLSGINAPSASLHSLVAAKSIAAEMNAAVA